MTKRFAADLKLGLFGRLIRRSCKTDHKFTPDLGDFPVSTSTKFWRVPVSDSKQSVAENKSSIWPECQSSRLRPITRASDEFTFPTERKSKRLYVSDVG
jgi:hypothetical protein